MVTPQMGARWSVVGASARGVRWCEGVGEGEGEEGESDGVEDD